MTLSGSRISISLSQKLEKNLELSTLKAKQNWNFEALHLHENYQATKYFIKFQQLAMQVQWGNAATLMTGLQWNH